MSSKVTSSETLSFPQFNWGIHKGEELELPSDKAAQAAILAHGSIKEVSATKTTEPSKK